MAEQYLPSEPTKIGIFLVLVNRASASVWDVARYGLDLRKKIAFVDHYTFHICDAESPFATMIMLNGHEWVTSGCQQKGIHFRKEGELNHAFE